MALEPAIESGRVHSPAGSEANPWLLPAMLTAYLTCSRLGARRRRPTFRRSVFSVAHLAPSHSDTTFTYTPAVFAQMLAQRDLVPMEISAVIDGLILLARRLARQFGGSADAAALNPFFDQPSPLNRILDEAGARQAVDQRRINALKLELSGRLHFLACKV